MTFEKEININDPSFVISYWSYTHTGQKYPDSSKKWSLNAYILPSIDHRNMKYISSESPWWDESNSGIFMRLESIDEKIIWNVWKQFFANNSPSNDARRIKIPPFNASRHDDSDDMCFIFLRPIDTEYDQNFKWQKLCDVAQI